MKIRTDQFERMFAMKALVWFLSIVCLGSWCGPVTAQFSEMRAAAEAMQQTEIDIGKWYNENIDRIRSEVAKHDKDARPFWSRLEADSLQKENQFLESANILEDALKKFETGDLARLDFAKLESYRNCSLLLAKIYVTMGRTEEAITQADHSWWAHQRMAKLPKPLLYADSQSTMEVPLTIAAVMESSGRFREALLYVEKIKEAGRAVSGKLGKPENDPILMTALLLEARLQIATRDFRKALETASRALVLFKQLYPYKNGHVQLAAALVVKAEALAANSENDKAILTLRESLPMLEKEPIKGKLLEAEATRLFAQILFRQGDAPKALKMVDHSRNAIMELFPDQKYRDGHPALVEALISLADLMNQSEQAEELYRAEQHLKAISLAKEAEAICRKLHNHKPHKQTVTTLLCSGRCLRDAGYYNEARDDIEEATKQAKELAALGERANDPWRKVDSQLLLALCQIDFGNVLAKLGNYEDARKQLGQAQGTYELLAPGVHSPLFAASLHLGTTALQQGQLQEARRAFLQALAIDRERIHSLAATAGEIEILTFAQPRQIALDGYLAATRNADDTVLEAFRAVWNAKNAVTRLAEARTRAIRVSKDPEASQLQAKAADLSKSLAYQLATGRPFGSSKRATGDLPESSPAQSLETRRRIDVELRQIRSSPATTLEVDGKGPDQLSARLPPGAVFVDFVRYADRSIPNEVTERYVAFVARAGMAPRRIVLDHADLIDEAVMGWRAELKDMDPKKQSVDRSELDRHAATLRALLWKPIEDILGANTRLLIVAPDGKLVLFPFAALPGAEPNSILLEKMAIAYVPHGQFLLEHLQPGSIGRAPNGRFVGFDDVEYGPARPDKHWYESLTPGDKILELMTKDYAPQPVKVLSGSGADVMSVIAELTQAGEVHMATHGEFDEVALERERSKSERAFRNWSPERANILDDIGGGQRYPLAYSWLALAGANDPDNTEFSGLLTAEVIAQLKLDSMRCIVLSACETGLGKYTAGEGVQGLQRAFHLAGCPNVIATLWQINNNSTAMLMDHYYLQRWQNKKSSLVALRRAQLAMYHGSIDPKRTHPQQWAAFVHSGLGDPLESLESLMAEIDDIQPGPNSMSAQFEYWLLRVGMPVLALLAILCLSAAHRLRKYERLDSCPGN